MSRRTRPGFDVGDVLSQKGSNIQECPYLDARKCLASGMELARSSNNVLLTGGFNGTIPTNLFEKVTLRYCPKRRAEAELAAEAPKVVTPVHSDEEEEEEEE